MYKTCEYFFPPISTYGYESLFAFKRFVKTKMSRKNYGISVISNF